MWTVTGHERYRLGRLPVSGYVSFETLIEAGLSWFVPLDRAEVLHEIGGSSLAVVCCRA
jgi:hypothetical protein